MGHSYIFSARQQINCAGLNKRENYGKKRKKRKKEKEDNKLNCLRASCFSSCCSRLLGVRFIFGFCTWKAICTQCHIIECRHVRVPPEFGQGRDATWTFPGRFLRPRCLFEQFACNLFRFFLFFLFSFSAYLQIICNFISRAKPKLTKRKRNWKWKWKWGTKDKGNAIRAALESRQQQQNVNKEKESPTNK